MKKLIIILFFLFLSQFTLVSANDIYSCTEKNISQDEINKVVSNINIGEIKTITNGFTYNVWEFDKINNIIKNNNLENVISKSNSSFIACKDEYLNKDEYSYNNTMCSVFIDYNKVKTFTYYKNEITTLNPNIYESVDGKHYAYSYLNEKKEICLNQDWNDKCYWKDYSYWWTNWVYYTFPNNLTFSADWSTFAYTIMKWIKWTQQICWADESCERIDWIKYANYIYINWKEYTTSNDKINNVNLWYDFNNEQDNIWFFPLEIKSLWLSQNWKNYAYINEIFDKSSSDWPRALFYKNWELLNSDLSSYGFEFFFDKEWNDLYYIWYELVENSTKELLFKNKNLISNDYIDYYIYKVDLNNLNFLWIKSKQWNDFYNVSCALKSDLNQQPTNQETKSTYALTDNEAKAIKVIWEKINKMTTIKKNKYISQLNQYSKKFKEWTKNYEIVKQLLEIIK